MIETGSSSAAPPQRGLAPDFYIVGHPKCGTTALYEMLKGHPEIHMPVKEPWFLGSDLAFRTTDRTPVSPQTLEQYLALFDGAEPGQRVGEASPMYLWSKSAAANIASLRPDAKIIAILREPASYLRSLHLQFLQTHVETVEDLETALNLEPARRAGREIPPTTYWPQMLLYSEHVRYVEQLSRYHAHFGKDRVLILTFDEFRNDNEATVSLVHRFIGVDDSVPVVPVDANPTVRLRSHRADNALRAAYMGHGPVLGGLKSMVKALSPQNHRRRLLEAVRSAMLHGDPVPLSSELSKKLQSQYKPEVVALSNYLGRDLVSQWGYESVD